jgi:hypothetical protein
MNEPVLKKFIPAVALCLSSFFVSTNVFAGDENVCKFPPPKTFMDSVVYMKTFTVAGNEKVDLPMIPRGPGPIPNANEDICFEVAAPMVRPADGKYSFRFALTLKNDRKPTRVTVEDVTGKEAIVLVDDTEPDIQFSSNLNVHFWNSSASDCHLIKGSACTQWITDKDPWFVFRATFYYPNNQTSTLYQAANFKNMIPALKTLMDKVHNR